MLPELRGRGIGKALLARVAALALEKGCQRLQWQVLDWNTPAIEFYRAMGGEFLDEWRNVRLGAEALERLAGQPQGLPPNCNERAGMGRHADFTGENAGDQALSSLDRQPEVSQ